MAMIQTTDEIMDKIRLKIATLGIHYIRKLHILFAAIDSKQLNQIANEEFMGALMKCSIFLSQTDTSSILKCYKANDIEVYYKKFIHDLSPPLNSEREQIVKTLFDLIKKETNKQRNIILYQDLITFCNVQNHPLIQSGQCTKNVITAMIKTSFDSIQDENGEITFENFKFYFRGISSGYPYNTNAFRKFMKNCWSDIFKKENNGDFTELESAKYICQIEAMLAEKTRQKIKGSEGERSCLLRAFKHFDAQKLQYVNYTQFARTLESFGVMAPQKDLEMFFAKWSKTDKDDKNKLFYRTFIDELFKIY